MWPRHDWQHIARAPQRTLDGAALVRSRYGEFNTYYSRDMVGLKCVVTTVA